MFNEKHLGIMEEGVTVWNEWRRKNPAERIHLHKANLSDADYLNGVDLHGADLSGAILNKANLRGADLNGADLHGAELIMTDLRGAILDWANLSDANLYLANLSDANLSDANLSGADLRKADLKWAYLRNINLIGNNLSRADLSGANLSGANLSGANLSRANLNDTYFTFADLQGADLSSANLSGAHLMETDLRKANLSDANLSGANFMWANLSDANLSGADLRGADFSEGNMVRTNFNRADLTGCRIYGVSAWDLNLQETIQLDLIITPHGDSDITVDNLEVAQFVYLLLKNEKIRDVINTIGKKAVLILGRFTPERKIILDSIRKELRRLNYVPILFDFEKPTDRDFTETIITLAGMCLFIIADITNPKSSPLELQATVPKFMIPCVTIIQEGEEPFSMFKDLKNKYEWVLVPLEYDSIANLVIKMEKAIINPALNKYDELKAKKAKESGKRHINDYF